jgi:hypothetical protein
MKDTAPQRATILVVDPDGDRRARLLRDLGAEAECLSAETGAAALKECQDNFVEVAIVACGRTRPRASRFSTRWRCIGPKPCASRLPRSGTAGLPEDLYQVCEGALPAEGMRRMLRNAVQLFRVRRENDRMSFEMRFMARKPGARPTGAPASMTRGWASRASCAAPPPPWPPPWPRRGTWRASTSPS